MPAPDGHGSAPSPNLFASLRSFWSVILAILYTRLDLVSAELEDEAVRAVKLLLGGVIAILAFAFAFFFINFFIIALAWSTPYRMWVIGGVLLVYFLIGAISALATRNMLLTRPKFLSQTIAELRRDVEGLNTAIKTHRDES
jgi:uncharacterized membrane protein YqjE